MNLPIARLGTFTLALLLCTACSRERPAADDGEGTVMEDPAEELEPQLSPVEAARARAAIQARADSATRAIREQSKAEFAESQADPAGASGLTPVQKYEKCVSRAQGLDPTTQPDVDARCKREAGIASP